MRLVLVTETFPPEVNGVARTLGRWLDALQERGHAVQVIRPRQHPERGTINRVLGLRIPFYPELRFGLASPLRVARALSRARPDLVHIATEGPLGLAALVAAGWLGVPVAASFHTNFDYYAEHYGLGPFKRGIVHYLRWFHNRAAMTLVPSAGTRRRLDQLGFRHVEVWSRGVDGDLFHPRFHDPAVRRELGLEADDCLILYAGRLAAEKNMAALIQAFGRLRARLDGPGRGRLRLALIGDGPMAASLRSLHVPGVVLPGMKLGVDLARWYASADVFAFPSVSETFGNVVLEALASGLPVVAYDCLGVNEQVSHEANGLLVPPGGDLAEALGQLIEQPGLRRRLGQEARRTAEGRAWGPIFDDLEERYRQIVGARTILRADRAKDLEPRREAK
jgi:glycosyltransferase involved in cell wall biosynthesis